MSLNKTTPKQNRFFDVATLPELPEEILLSDPCRHTVPANGEAEPGDAVPGGPNQNSQESIQSRWSYRWPGSFFSGPLIPYVSGANR